MKVIVTIICLIFLGLQTVFAANDMLDVNSAQVLLEGGKPRDALDLLLAKHDPKSTSSQEWFLMAMAAKSCNRPRQASSYLEKVIELDPEQAGRAKLELAQMAYTLGDGKTAKNYLAEVKAAKPPAKVGDNIDQFLEVIETQGTPKNWSVSGSVGWMYDSNVNAGPGTDSILMFGLPFILNTNAKKRSDNANVIALWAGYNKGITDDLGWQTSFSVGRTDYNVVDELDSLQLSGSTGPSWLISDKFVVSVPLVIDWVKLGHDESYYSSSYGVAPQFRYAIFENLSFNLGTTLSKKNYRVLSARDSDNYSISPSLMYQFSPTSFARIGLVGGREDSGLAYTENKLWGANALYGHVFWESLQATLNLAYIDTDYKGKEAAYNEARHDKTIKFGVELAYRINKLNSDIVLSVNRTVNDSNLDIYEYDRDQISLCWKLSY